MSTKAVNEPVANDPAIESKHEEPISRRFWRRGKAHDDGLKFILLEDARVPVALPRGRKLAPLQRPPRGRW